MSGLSKPNFSFQLALSAFASSTWEPPRAAIWASAESTGSPGIILGIMKLMVPATADHQEELDEATTDVDERVSHFGWPLLRSRMSVEDSDRASHSGCVS